MKSVIYKYPFEIKDEIRLELPLGAQILFIEKQKQYGFSPVNGGVDTVIEQSCLWAQADPDQERKEFRHFRIIGTGHEFNSKGMHYIGSLMMANDQLVWHVHEIVVPGAL